MKVMHGDGVGCFLYCVFVCKKYGSKMVRGVFKS